MASIRKMKESDSRVVASLISQLGYIVTNEEVQLQYLNITENNGAGIFVAVSEDDKIVGWVHMSIYHSLIIGRMAIVLGIVVDEALRNKGIGRLLMQAGAEWARNNDCIGIKLNSGAEREDAHMFYLKNGFKMKKSQLAFVKML
ncbi:acetyltransferase (GNAT) family protein [Natranaerovirga pectinivora]|uniref:Acetyltransferase (GNAT) family protein n=1 Tax=Natranaerovirga pectinivora TaxID=682400 RepID=A0A4R3MPN5_9FIRM|nr:GNAT family N-acetyltransferase [Natranaerovirga pectinivora]TCT17201.1 acetyltransferase (GNAT) family protein [Natranaerovirga pectinivora]